MINNPLQFLKRTKTFAVKFGKNKKLLILLPAGKIGKSNDLVGLTINQILKDL